MNKKIIEQPLTINYKKYNNIASVYAETAK